jgi:membrane protease YdiL (CAAX protease family)
MNSQTYLDLARQGKNEWWRYLASLGLIGFLWLFVGSIPYLILTIYVIADSNPDTYIDQVAVAIIGIDPVIPFVAVMLSFVAFFISIYLAVKFIHRRPFHTLISPGPVRWGRMAQAFVLWGLLAALIAALEAYFYPGRYQLTFDPVPFLIFAVLSIVFIPIQTSAEELFFRAYMLQSVGLRIRNALVLCMLSGFLFMLPHLANPEVTPDTIFIIFFYYAFGAFLALITLKEGGLELALGVHAANNLFTAIFANYEGSALSTPAIFTASELDINFNLVSVLVAMAVFYIFIFALPSRLKQS